MGTSSQICNKAAASLTESLLIELAAFGADPSGGVTRLLYTESWKEAQSFLAERMKKLGFEVRYDRVGNLYGTMQGVHQHLKPILTGSHIDTVSSGGDYDGAYGVVAGIAAIAQLVQRYGPPQRTLEVVAFCEEEGSRFPLAYWGSGNMTGVYDWHSDGADRYDPKGVSLREAMERAGFGRVDQPACEDQLPEAFIELHIEQGPVLERTNTQIGIVEAIVGQRRYQLSVMGAANHAGTTPMPYRKDAMTGAAEMILMIETEAKRRGEPLVATVGSVKASPNTPNVIAGSLEFTLDIRHPDEGVLETFSDWLLGRCREIAEHRGLTFTASPWLTAKPAPMNRELTDRLERICAEGSLSYRRMASGAGHDAQMLSARCPAAMLFVPSRDGVSHSPDEYTAPEQLADGVGVLASLLYELAYKEQIV